jgi:hypothetical protein
MRTTNINEELNVSSEISVYPNPASDYIEIKYKSVETGLRPVSTVNEIRIYNALGECMKNLTPNLIHTPAPLERGIGDGVLKVDISHLPVGVYFIQSRNYSEKFVVVR